MNILKNYVYYVKTCSHIFIASGIKIMAPAKFRSLKTTPNKVNQSPAKGGFVRTSSSGNRVFVQRGNEGFMTAYVTKGSNTKESAYIKPYLDFLNDAESNDLNLSLIHI